MKEGLLGARKSGRNFSWKNQDILWALSLSAAGVAGNSLFKNSLRTPGHPTGRQCLKSWDAPFEFPESPDFNNSQDRSSACGFPVEFEMFVISFSYLIPGGGPGKTEA